MPKHPRTCSAEAGTLFLPTLQPFLNHCRCGAKLVFVLFVVSGCGYVIDNFSSSPEETSNTSDSVADHFSPEARKLGDKSSANPLILDAEALQQVWQRFFNDQQITITAEQRRQLGSVNYLNHGIGTLNGYRITTVDQAYVKAMRTVLVSLCTEQVDREMANVSNGDNAQHIVVKRNGAPTKEDVIEIMSRMFGYQTERGADVYAKLIADNLQNSNDPEEIKAQYILLCMAIGQDTRVWLR